jgi:hypothetical protein
MVTMKKFGLFCGLMLLLVSCSSPTAPVIIEDGFYKASHEPTEFVTGHAEPVGESEPPIPPPPADE